jgi:hypothetical protein
MKTDEIKNLFVMACSIGITVLFLSLTFCPVTAIPNRSLSTSHSDNMERIEVTCNIFTNQGIERIIKKISRERFERITNLTRELSTSFSETSSAFEMRKKITVLLGELENEGLLPRTNKVQKVADQFMNRWMMSPQFLAISNNLHKNQKMINDTQANIFNLIFGVGRNTYAVKPITEMVIDYVFAFYVYFNLKFLYKIVELLEHRPKMAIGFGLWEASKGGNITTIGLRGIQQWGPDADNNIGIAFKGFVGLAMSTRYINDTGLIIGFSYQSIRITS